MNETQNQNSALVSAIYEMSELEKVVRHHINTTRYQTTLISNLDIWNQICSSLDTIGDTLLSIEAYVVSPYPEAIGLKYIHTYGILQAIFIQQDAMRHLSEAFSLEYFATEKLQKIRALRNAAIGHPTKNNVQKTVYYNYISRISLQKWGFTLLRSSESDRTEFIDVDLMHLIKEQVDEIKVSYKLLADKLVETDKMHKEKHKDNFLVDIFPSSTGYLFEKVSQGIHTPHGGNREFGLSMLQSIEGIYQKFETSLAERGDLNEYIRFDLAEYKHGISVLKFYLSGENTTMQETDARIYGFFLYERHKHFVKIAEEIDEEYSEKA